MTEPQEESGPTANDFEGTVPKININWVISWILGGLGILTWFLGIITSEDTKFWLLGVYLLLLAFGVIYREYAFNKAKSTYSSRIKELHRKCRDAVRYKNSVKNLHDCAHSMRDAFDRIIENNEAAANSCIQTGLNKLANAFSFISGSNCRACIKIIQNDVQDNFYTATLSRSGRSSAKTAKDAPNKILNNTDFMMLFDKKINFFFSNDLSSVSPYHNSNWPDDPQERESFINNKKYDYISTIVWPIRSCNENDEIKVIGFLCIDSRDKDVFNTETDIDFGASMADLLYPVLYAYRSSIVLPKEEAKREEEGKK